MTLVGIYLGLRLYFIVYPSSRPNADTVLDHGVRLNPFVLLDGGFFIFFLAVDSDEAVEPRNEEA